MLKKISLSSYLLGVFTTMIIFAIILVSMGIYYTKSGISVTIGVKDIPAVIKEEVVSIVEYQLPLYINELKAEIPYIIDTEMTGKMENASIKLGDVEYPLPADSIKAIEDVFKGQVQVAMLKLLEGLDETIIAENMSKDVELKFVDFMDGNINNRVFTLNPIRPLKIPVTVSLSYEEEDAIPVVINATD
ncbi:hypothetical protein HYG86_17530 [Alkalicella caledoniensis]|uniref:Uncharacterized protein n=1 Tax=Alkalicella caledoniensis TaxID=2731377 RepID=A0A7G9WCN5_ALKCA|nr:hypothetical protein [Alkalicella caledoniensis]QNO16447.1 hypothetical protein HYG86_17530 [Alkalicella caledoniensis]